MVFPTIYTNIWDVLLAIPFVMILTQITKMIFHIKSFFVPTLSIVIGLLLSIFISHNYDLLAGIFMGFVYGYGAIGNYASMKTSYNAYRKRKSKKFAAYNHTMHP
ncbi:hypothetical protein [Ureibacillus acetophenoni]|uniref:Uncharacterized protein n=1 Tax=Ureibacillus acetophenoni TaxID=614649 RepID=A0A285UH33_9BACL|nr:hypothetical protein [Ureibacillus acetophenoni]SOC39896.1 hypothetical protein SAMN05877842_106175 [Ureibacillus acetophenoni]